MPVSTLGSCISSVAFTTSNPLIGETASSGPSVNGDKYAGTLGWNFSIPSGPTLTYWMVYDVRKWNTTTSAWDFVVAGTMHTSDAGGSSGAHTVDFFVNASLATHGDYGVTAYLVDENNAVAVTKTYKFYYSTTSSPTFSAHLYSYNPTHNDLGDDPPITQPELPPTGPVGPGSSS